MMTRPLVLFNYGSAAKAGSDDVDYVTRLSGTQQELLTSIEEGHNVSEREPGRLLTPRTAENQLSAIFGLDIDKRTAAAQPSGPGNIPECNILSSTANALERDMPINTNTGHRNGRKGNKPPQSMVALQFASRDDEKKSQHVAASPMSHMNSLCPSPRDKFQTKDGVTLQMRLPVKRTTALMAYTNSEVDSKSDARLNKSRGHEKEINRKGTDDQSTMNQSVYEIGSFSPGVFSLPSSSNNSQAMLLPVFQGAVSPSKRQPIWNVVTYSAQEEDDSNSKPIDQTGLCDHGESDSNFFGLEDNTFKTRDDEFAITADEMNDNEFSLPSPSDMPFLPFTASQPGPMDRTM
jgi:hypothetical protein